MQTLWAVGIGPGGAEFLTGQAREALDRAEVLCGYTVYVELVAPLFPGKETYTTPMRQELERCRWALEKAQSGKEVAFLCSGDAGVYGMAGLLLQLAPQYPGVEVQVVPGVTAALSGGAVLGAPLGHDFCVVSLSDLLTPWEAIEKRLRCAAVGDFCLCLYNPSSRKRADYLKRACDILLEAGKSVILFEKQDIAGGSMPMTYSGVAAAESQLQTNYALGRADENPMYKKELMLGVMQKYLVAENDRFDGAMPYQTAMYSNSGQLVDWMHDMGIGFYSLGVNKAYGVTPYLAPGCYMGGCGYAKDFLVDRVGALGGQIVYATKVTELVQDADGRVTGLKAEGRDGSTWTVTAKAVCLTSGGFAANEEMLKEHYPDYAEFKFNCAPGSTGDGIELGMQAGGAIECMGRELGAFLSTTNQAGSNFEIAFLYQTTPGILVNASGKQFGNIMSDNHGVLGRALLDEANGGAFYYITDEAGRITTNKNELYAMDTYKCLEHRGDMVHYDSVEAAAEELGLPELAATLETHNAHALAGEEDEFGRSKLPYLDTHDGIWVVSCIPTFYLTTGGLVIDTAGHVQNDAGEAIPGLYAAGDVCGSIEEKDGRPYAMGFDAALNYGYLMAETVKTEI